MFICFSLPLVLCLSFGFGLVVGLARSEALRARRASVQGEAEGKANDGTGATGIPPPIFLSTTRRMAKRHGWSAGGTHFCLARPDV